MKAGRNGGEEADGSGVTEMLVLPRLTGSGDSGCWCLFATGSGVSSAVAEAKKL